MAKKTSVKKAKKAKAPKGKIKPAAAVTPSGTLINTWEQDPGSGSQPTGGQMIQRPAPVLSSQPLPTRITNPSSAPAPGLFQAGTPQFRYYVCAEALRRGSDFWGPLTGKPWQMGNVLPVDLDNGIDLNAFYDRIGLKFFHGTAGTRTVFSGESPDVVCHELGHAVLDSIKPQLWDAASMEIAGFHESAGDISALLCGLQLESVRHAVLQETHNIVYRASQLSRVAEQLGWAIRQSSPDAVEADCLRNAVNKFFYRDPLTLPTSAPASMLSSEPHSFSRVFTAAFFEGLAGMFATRPTKDEANLLAVSQDAGKIFVSAVVAASVVPSFYSQVAAGMLTIASSQYRAPLRSAFVRHGVLPPTAAPLVAAAPAAVAAAAPPAQQAAELPPLTLSVGEYGLGVSSIVVRTAADQKHFDVAGAAASLGAAPAQTGDVTAKAFFEDLLRRGKLKIAKNTAGAAAMVASLGPGTHDRHTHELRSESGQTVLRRLRVDCRCGAC